MVSITTIVATAALLLSAFASAATIERRDAFSIWFNRYYPADGVCSGKKPYGKDKLRQGGCKSWKKEAEFGFEQWDYSWKKHWEQEVNPGSYGDCTIKVYAETDCKGEVVGVMKSANSADHVGFGKTAPCMVNEKPGRSAQVMC